MKDAATAFITKLRAANWFTVDEVEDFGDGAAAARFHAEGIKRGVVIFKSADFDSPSTEIATTDGEAR